VIADIVFEWNVLTSTMVAWLVCVSLAVAADAGPEMVRDAYREKKARAQLMESVTKMAERRQIAKPVTFDPDATFQLGVFKIQPEPAVRRRHAKV